MRARARANMHQESHLQIQTDGTRGNEGGKGGRANRCSQKCLTCLVQVSCRSNQIPATELPVVAKFIASDSARSMYESQNSFEWTICTRQFSPVDFIRILRGKARSYHLLLQIADQVQTSSDLIRPHCVQHKRTRLPDTS